MSSRMIAISSSTFSSQTLRISMFSLLVDIGGCLWALERCRCRSRAVGVHELSDALIKGTNETHQDDQPSNIIVVNPPP